MTIKQLEDARSGISCSAGTVRYSIKYRGKWYRCECNDTISFDRIRQCDEITDNQKGVLGLTYKQALYALYRAGLKQHRLSTYKID